MLVARRHADSVSHLGEIQLIRQIKSWLGPVNPPLPNGIGDDCAIIEPVKIGRQLITTDCVSYGQHFDDRVTAGDAGAKLIKRNISDIAAMGGVPGPAVLALLCSPNVSIKWLEGFFCGIRQTCMRYSIPLVGGDVSALKETALSAVLTLTGSVITPKLRSASQIGDSIYVTGTLGGSILGKHFEFEPRLAEGQWISKQQECHAMVDLSDGLGKDLLTLLPADASAHLLLDKIPISDAASELAKRTGRDKREHAFCDGEDYELLFTVSKHMDRCGFETNWKHNFPGTQLTCIGTIERGSNETPYLDALTKNPVPWTCGFEHLKT